MAHVPPLPDTGAFDGPTHNLIFDGFLFDMDGTIIDSTDAIVKSWHEIAADLNVSATEILHSSHGRRSIDTLALWSPQHANWAYVNEKESRIPHVYGSSAVEIPGARALLDHVTALSAPWAIVTSASRSLVTGWFEVLKLPDPPAMVVAEDVKNGKPDPEAYLLGRERAGLAQEGKKVLVFEDAPAGVTAGKAAGCCVLGLATTHEIGRVQGAGADWIVRDLGSVSVRRLEDGRFEVQVRDVWREKGEGA